MSITRQAQQPYVENYTLAKTIATIDLSKEVTDMNGETYTEVEPTSDLGAWPLFSTEHHDYGFSTSGANYTCALVYEQNMNLALTTKYAEDAIILKKDKDKIPVTYKVKNTYNGKESFVHDNGNNVFAKTLKFTTSQSDDALYSYGNDPYYHAIKANQLALYYKDGKRSSVYTLAPEIISPDAKETARLNKCYTLETTGDELNGWQVTLKSNIKKGEKIIKDEEIAYETVYIDDPNLLVGEEVVQQAGVMGHNVTKQAYYYLLDANQQEEVLEEAAEVNEHIAPINKVVLRGTAIAYVPSNHDTELVKAKSNKMTVAKTGELATTVSNLGLIIIASIGIYLTKKH